MRMLPISHRFNPRSRAGDMLGPARRAVLRPSSSPQQSAECNGDLLDNALCYQSARSDRLACASASGSAAPPLVIVSVVSDGRRLIEPVRPFLSAPRCAVLSTLGPDGAPRQIVIHYMLGEDHIRLNGHRDRHWVANVRRDPRVALIVHDDTNYLHYVSIRGRAALVDEREDALAEAMSQAERYGEDPADYAGRPRVSFRVDPEHVHEYG